MNYEDHPSFRSAGAAWILPQASIDEFHAAYCRLRRPRPSLRARDVACRLLDGVMKCLAAQAGTPEEHDFVLELQLQTCRLMGEEFSHYQRCRPLREPSSSTAKRALHDLRQQRFTIGRLESGDLEAIVESARPHIVRFENNVRDGKRTREDLSINSGPAIAAMTTRLNQAFRDNGILDAVSVYMGQHMVVGGMALEYSHHGSTWWRHALADLPAPKTIYAHVDEAITIPKAIVYLSDVDRTQGPTSCYPDVYESLSLNSLQELIGRVIAMVGNVESSRLKAYYDKPYHQSMGSSTFRQHFMKLPSSLRFNSHFGWDVIPGSSLEADLVDRETFVVGPAGTFLAFDGGRLLHRGGLVEEGSRTALQVIFSPQAPVRTSRRVKNFVRGALAKPRALVKAFRSRGSSGDLTAFCETVSKSLPSVCCIDVGASYFPHEKWRVFLDSPRTHWIAVEPNPQNAGYIRQWRWQASPQLLGVGLSRHGGKQTLYVTNVDSGSSLFPPVIGASMQHRVTSASRDYFFPVREVPIETLTLAQVIEKTDATNPLLIKLDTQGSELDILRGAHEQLRDHRCVGIEIESSLLAEPLMHGGAQFWQVCEYLQSLGFELMHIDPIMASSRVSPAGARGRRWLNECDAVFMLRRDVVRTLSVPYRAALVGFQLTYDLFEEALSLIQEDAEVGALFEAAHCSPRNLETAIRGRL